MKRTILRLRRQRGSMGLTLRRLLDRLGAGTSTGPEVVLVPVPVRSISPEIWRRSPRPR